MTAWYVNLFKLFFFLTYFKNHGVLWWSSADIPLIARNLIMYIAVLSFEGFFFLKITNGLLGAGITTYRILTLNYEWENRSVSCGIAVIFWRYVTISTSSSSYYWNLYIVNTRFMHSWCINDLPNCDLCS